MNAPLAPHNAPSGVIAIHNDLDGSIHVYLHLHNNFVLQYKSQLQHFVDNVEQRSQYEFSGLDASKPLLQWGARQITGPFSHLKLPISANDRLTALLADENIENVKWQIQHWTKAADTPSSAIIASTPSVSKYSFMDKINGFGGWISSYLPKSKTPKSAQSSGAPSFFSVGAPSSTAPLLLTNNKNNNTTLTLPLKSNVPTASTGGGTIPIRLPARPNLWGKTGKSGEGAPIPPPTTTLLAAPQSLLNGIISSPSLPNGNKSNTTRANPSAVGGNVTNTNAKAATEGGINNNNNISTIGASNNNPTLAASGGLDSNDGLTDSITIPAVKDDLGLWYEEVNGAALITMVLPGYLGEKLGFRVGDVPLTPDEESMDYDVFDNKLKNRDQQQVILVSRKEAVDKVKVDDNGTAARKFDGGNGGGDTSGHLQCAGTSAAPNLLSSRANPTFGATPAARGTIAAPKPSLLAGLSNDNEASLPASVDDFDFGNGNDDDEMEIDDTPKRGGSSEVGDSLAGATLTSPQRLALAMEASRTSQQTIQDFDRKNGLRANHQFTLGNSYTIDVRTEVCLFQSGIGHFEDILNFRREDTETKKGARIPLTAFIAKSALIYWGA